MKHSSIQRQSCHPMKTLAFVVVLLRSAHLPLLPLCLSVCLIMALVALLGSLSFELRSFVALSVVISGVCSAAAAAAAAKWSRSLFKRVFKSRPSFKLSRAREEGRTERKGGRAGEGPSIRTIRRRRQKGRRRERQTIQTQAAATALFPARTE